MQGKKNAFTDKTHPCKQMARENPRERAVMFVLIRGTLILGLRRTNKWEGPRLTSFKYFTATTEFTLLHTLTPPPSKRATIKLIMLLFRIGMK